MKVTIGGKEYVGAEPVRMVNMPKLESPFVRCEHFEGERKRYLVIPEIAEGMDWVFEDDDVLAVEKLDGTNVSCWLQGGSLLALNNRLNEIPIGVLERNKFLDGVRTTAGKHRLPRKCNGQNFGELMGPGVQRNFLELDQCEWFPFEYMQEKFYYKLWGRYPKDFDTISRWFQHDIFSLAYVRYHGKKVPPEGVVFYQPSTGRMAKLRLDMFDWYDGEFTKKVQRG